MSHCHHWLHRDHRSGTSGSTLMAAVSSGSIIYHIPKHRTHSSGSPRSFARRDCRDCLLSKLWPGSVLFPILKPAAFPTMQATACSGTCFQVYLLGSLESFESKAIFRVSRKGTRVHSSFNIVSVPVEMALGDSTGPFADAGSHGDHPL